MPVDVQFGRGGCRGGFRPLGERPFGCAIKGGRGYLSKAAVIRGIDGRRLRRGSLSKTTVITVGCNVSLSLSLSYKRRERRQKQGSIVLEGEALQVYVFEAVFFLLCIVVAVGEASRCVGSPCAPDQKLCPHLSLVVISF